MKEFLSQNNIEFLYLDITDSMLNLKRFLKYRDIRPEFDEIKKSGSIGIPCIMVNKAEHFIFEQSEIKKFINS